MEMCHEETRFSYEAWTLTIDTDTLTPIIIQFNVIICVCVVH
jgi:hypothetical protein